MGINIKQIIRMIDDYFIWIVRKDLSDKMTLDLSFE